MGPFDFSTGTTNPETFPTEELAAAAARTVRKHAVELNTYPGSLGHEGLRRLMARREFDREGVRLDPERIALTNGSMQAVTLVAEALCEGRDDVVVMEEYCYSGTISAYQGLGIELVGVPVDGRGMRTDALQSALEGLREEGRAPRFIYVLATYQNPTGSVMPRERRLELLRIARAHRCIVVEDNCYGDVHYEGEKVPALYALDDGPRQVYLCSLSKIFAPGVRLGYLTASSAELFERIVERRHDAGPNTLAAAISAEYLGDRLWEHVETANRALKAKRDAMLVALESELGNTCSWSAPAGRPLHLGAPSRRQRRGAHRGRRGDARCQLLARNALSRAWRGRSLHPARLRIRPDSRHPRGDRAPRPQHRGGGPGARVEARSRLRGREAGNPAPPGAPARRRRLPTPSRDPEREGRPPHRA